MKNKTENEKHQKRDCESDKKKKEKSVTETKENITLTPEDAMSLYLYLTRNGIITKEELERRCLDEGSPFKKIEIKIKPNLSKSQTKKFWRSLATSSTLLCEICGNPITQENLRGNKDWALTVEHRKPQSKGGSNNPNNLGPAHRICNELKGDVSPEEWEKTGLYKLLLAGIPINLDQVRYDYLKVLREQSFTKIIAQKEY